MLTPRPNRAPKPRANGAANHAAGGRTPLDEPRSFSPTSAARRPLPARWEAVLNEPIPTIALDTDIIPPVDRQKRALIVIPALNEAEVIASVIERVLDDDGLVEPLVVVADGGSTDGTQDIVREIARNDRRVRLMDNPARLQSAGVNLAVQTLAGDRAWIIRVDAHADYPKNYASTLIAEAMRTGASSVVVSMDTVGEGGFQRAVATAQNSVLGTGGSAHRLATEGRWVDHGHHALFSRAAFQQIGGYDEGFSHNEDAELDLRLANHGGRIWLTDKLRIGYYPRRTPGALWKQYFSYGKGRARTVLKHRTPLKIRQAVPLAVAPAAVSVAAAPFFWWFAVPALVWALASLGFGLLLGLKKGERSAFLSGPAAMIMHLSWSLGFWAQIFSYRPPKITEADVLAQMSAQLR